MQRCLSRFFFSHHIGSELSNFYIGQLTNTLIGDHIFTYPINIQLLLQSGELKRFWGQTHLISLGSLEFFLSKGNDKSRENLASKRVCPEILF